MKTNRMRFGGALRASWVAVAGILAIGLFSCRSSMEPAREIEAPAASRSILILPFTDMASIYGIHSHVRSPISGKYFYTGPVDEGSTPYLEDAVAEGVKARGDWEAFPSGAGQGIRSEMLIDEGGRLDDRKAAVVMGRELGADAVLVGYIFCFKERIGTDFSVEEPASASFEMHLIETESGRIIWSGHMEETQRPLSEDLLQIGAFVKRKGRWVTVRELAALRLEDLLSRIPGP